MPCGALCRHWDRHGQPGRIMWTVQRATQLEIRPEIRSIQAVPMRVMMEQSNDLKVEVQTLSFDVIDGVVHYMKDAMPDRLAAKQARSRLRSLHWWDDQSFITTKITMNEFVARMMDHMADQDEPVGSNPPTCRFPRSGIGSKPDTPFNIQEF